MAARIRKSRRKHLKDRAKFPIATIAIYGPNKDLATKMVVAIIEGPDCKPTHIQKWFSEDVDIRSDEDINQEAFEFAQEHGVVQMVAADRIIGCPHEEGIDYPAGGVCPDCPFWATIDRFSHEPVS